MSRRLSLPGARGSLQPCPVFTVCRLHCLGTHTTTAPACSLELQLDLRKLYTDPSFQPGRLIGPVEVQVPAGEGLLC